MPIWIPTREWDNQKAFLIGGGASLKSFDFNRLKGLNTIGCNDAFRLGPEICKICLFGDKSWWYKTKEELAGFKGRVVSGSSTVLEDATEEWLLKIPRKNHGLGIPGEGRIAWNYSTGAMAVNLAFLLGAVKIYLLGYDLCRLHATHWHHYRNRITNNKSYMRFQRGFNTLAMGLSVFPEVQVFNVTPNGISKLEGYPRLELSEVFPNLLDGHYQMP